MPEAVPMEKIRVQTVRILILEALPWYIDKLFGTLAQFKHGQSFQMPDFPCS